MTDYSRVLQVLKSAQVDFILIGGVAANLHGSARATFDIDFVYSRKRDNIQRLAEALAPFRPYLRGAPPGLPFKFDVQTIRSGLNFTLDTALGAIDLMGEVTGGGTFEELLSHTVEVEAFGVKCRCVGLERLIQLKRACGRPKDFEAIAELQALLEEQRKKSGDHPSS
jgi:predicted nucleotidyltransferase